MPEPRWADAPEALRAGRLEGVSVPELVWRLSQARATGVLRVDCEGRTKALHLADGRVVFATSQDPDDRLGSQLLQRGWITLDALEEALARQAGSPEPWSRLGHLLVARGAIDHAQLAQAVVAQIQSIAFELFARERGEYQFERGPLPTDEAITLDVPTHELIARGIKQTRGVSRLRRAVGGSSAVYVLAPDWRRRVAGLELGGGDELLLVRLEAGPRSVDALCRELLLPDFEVLKLLWCMKILGVVEGGASHRDVTAAPSFIDLLVELARGRETGVLHASRAGVERSFQMRSGRCTFATSSAPDDSLLAHLLRRGTISLREREEGVSRLLTNKRIGSLLLELGAIDHEQLRAFVREHVLEIVCDTFGWEDGDYRFVSGAVHSTEDITLDLSPEALVREGLRSITSWQRLAAECGGLDAVVGLSPEYLAVLDAMQADVEEWEVVTALKEPQSVRQLARAARCSTHRLCQIVWTLRLLGAVRAVETVPAVDCPTALVAADAVPAAEVEPWVPAEVVAASESVAPFEVAGRAGIAPPAPMLVGDLSLAEPPTTGVSAADGDEPPRAECEAEPGEVSTQVAIEFPADGASVDAQTAELPLEVTEPALAFDSGASVPADPGSDAAATAEDWVPPGSLDDDISRFNALQRLIYRTVRAEVGAGAVNVIRACCLGGTKPAVALDAAGILADGSWDPLDLRRAACAHRLAEPGLEYDRLIRTQLAALRPHLAGARLAALQEQLDHAGRVTPSDSE